MMPLEDIRCTLALCPNREAREKAKLGRMAVVAKKMLPFPGYARVLVR
jgi:hypothetical protein